MTPEELIEKGIEIIERDGWHQGDLYDRPSWVKGDTMEAYGTRVSKAARTAPVCGIGSLYRAALGTCATKDVADLERNANGTVLGEAVRMLHQQVVDNGFNNGFGAFNDQPTTTKEDVVLTMKKAAHHDS